MSGRRRLRKPKPSSLPSSPIVSEAASIVPPDAPEFFIRYAENDDDIIAIHQFLLFITPPVLRCPLDPLKVLHEVIRITRDEVALMLIHKGLLVGSMGIIRPTWWYGDGEFLADRWHFVLPQHDSTEGSQLLMDEALKLGELAGLEFIHQGRIRQGKKGAARMMPRVYLPESDNVTSGGLN